MDFVSTQQGKSRKGLIVLFFLIALHILVVGYIGFNRSLLFTDEVYSYGLANSENYTFCEPESNLTLLDWTDSSFFQNYMQYDRSKPFSFHAAFVNQANDVHPPLYYCLLHIVSYFWFGSWYSPVPGVILNLLMLPIIDLLLFSIAKYFTSNPLASFSTVVLWAFSSAGLSNAIFIRMYLLVSLWILVLVYYHIFLAKALLITTPSSKKVISFRYILYCVILCTIVTVGGLTHYYFYFFAAALGCCVCLYLLLFRKYKAFFIYGICLWLGVGLALLIFPQTLNHLFTHRGSYATNNLGSFNALKFQEYFSYINQSLFAGCFWFLAILLFIVFIWQRIVRVSIQEYSRENYGFKILFSRPISARSLSIFISAKTLLLFAFLFASLAFVYVSVQGSEIINARYIYPAFPLISLFIVAAFVKAFKNIKKSDIIILSGSILIALLSIKSNGVDWTYPGYSSQIPGKNSLIGKDCVIICKDDTWINVLEAANIYGEADEVRCVYESQIDSIFSILQERKTNDPICVAFFSDEGYSDDQQIEILKKIQALLGFSDFELSYDYLTKVYSFT